MQRVEFLGIFQGWLRILCGVILFGVASVNEGRAQSDSTVGEVPKVIEVVELGCIIPPIYTFLPVEIQTERPRRVGCKLVYLAGERIQENHSADLGRLLGAYSPVFIKSYGPGAVATPAFRGLGAEHTLVLWNGLPVNSPILGMSDFSLFPASWYDKVRLDFGSGSLTHNTGGMGGSIHLLNQPKWNSGARNGIRFQQSVGSFGRYQGNLAVRIQRRNFISSTSLMLRAAKNEYPFLNTAVAGHPEQTVQNGDVYQYGLMQEFYFRIKSNTEFSLKSWYQNSERGVISPMVSFPAGERLADASLKTVAEMTHRTGYGVFNLNLGHVGEKLQYTAPVSGINAVSRFQLLNGFFTFAPRSANRWVQLIREAGGTLQYSQARVPEYTKDPWRVRAAAFILLNKRFRDKISLELGLRQDLVNGNPAPFLPSLGVEWQVLNKPLLSWKAHFSRNFRLPTFNHLYWSPGGNPDLLAEQGWAGETGFEFQHLFSPSGISFTAGLTGHMGLYNNFIIWLPTSSSAVWAPSNLKEVFSRGLELSSTVGRQQGKFQWQATANYTYTLSQNRKPTGPSDHSVGKQLLYVPLHNFNAVFRADYRGFYLVVSQGVTGKRFSSTDNSDEVAGFALTDVSIGRFFFDRKLSLQFQVRNLWNTRYQNVRWIPMPGRSFEGTLGIEF